MAKLVLRGRLRIAVLMIGVKDGGGRIRKSAGGINEAGVFWKPARWVDYAGRTSADKLGRFDCFD